MTVPDTYESLSLLLFASFTAMRLVPRLIWPTFFGSDVQYHSFVIQMIAANGHRIPEKVDRIVGGPNGNTYPMFYHWLLSYLSAKWRMMADRYSGLLFDSISSVVIAAALWANNWVSFPVAAGASAIYLLAPGLTFSAIGPRAFSLTPRNFAHVFATIGFITLIFAQGSSGVYYWVGIGVSTVFLSVVLLSSKFGTQHLLLVLPLAAAFSMNLGPLWALLGSVLFASIVGRSIFIRQVDAQIQHLEWYYRHARGFVSHKGDWGRLISAIRNRDFPKIVGELFFHNPILVGLTRHFPLFLALLIFADFRSHQSVPPSINVAFGLVVASIVPWIITSAGSFRILGEADRYLEFSFGPAWFLLWAVSPAGSHATLILGLGFYAIGFYLITLAIIRFQITQHRTDECDAVVEYVNSRNDGRVENDELVVLCLSLNEIYHFLARSNVKIVGFNCNASIRGDHEGFFSELLWRYPIVNPHNLVEICRRFRVDLVVNNRLMERTLISEAGKGYDFDGMICAYENERYAVYRP